MVRTISVCIAAGLLVGSTTASFADAFTSAVEKVLMQEERIKELKPARQKEMIACANEVLATAPNPTKREVAQAPNFDEMQARFGKMVLANRAKLEKAITSTCGHIIVDN